MLPPIWDAMPRVMRLMASFCCATIFSMSSLNFIVRINSGDSGPGCVAAQVQAPGTYDAITAVPSGYLPIGEDFLTRAPACAFVADGSGLTTSPRTALSEFYAYTTCVAMSDKPFVLTTMTGRHVKLVINTYYAT
jgi:hypothetical protein